MVTLALKQFVKSLATISREVLWRRLEPLVRQSGAGSSQDRWYISENNSVIGDATRLCAIIGQQPNV